MKIFGIVILLIFFIFFIISLFNAKAKIKTGIICVVIFIGAMFFVGHYRLKNYDENVKYINFERAFVQKDSIICPYESKDIIVNSSNFLLINGYFTSVGINADILKDITYNELSNEFGNENISNVQDSNTESLANNGNDMQGENGTNTESINIDIAIKNCKSVIKNIDVKDNKTINNELLKD